jgi:hypothetical protein
MLFTIAAILVLSALSARAITPDEALCRTHTAANANATWRRPSGVLSFPYLVPAGPYAQCWDWDSVFLGVATLPWGSRPNLAGSMMNFFSSTNLTDGSVTGCLTPTLPTVCSSSSAEHDALVHAKPILIQGAWLAASAPGGDPHSFERFAPAMQALLAYWDRPTRRDNATGLRVWHDQMESGADNCVLSQCPNRRSPCWTDSQAFSLASADVMTLLQREHLAFSLFTEAWSELSRTESDSKLYRALAAKHRVQADALTTELNNNLWRADLVTAVKVTARLIQP